jgi:predicted  nucleic acid-binding Zn-ribbon protein
MLNVDYSVEKKFQTAGSSIIQVRDAGVEVLAELKNRLEMLSGDDSTQRNLNATITDLREENTTLKERLHSRDAEFSRIERQFNEIKQELQECRTQLTATTNDLGKAVTAPREDTFLRTQLQDLQTSYSIAKDEADSSANEMERVRADLHEQEKLTLLAQQETSKLQDELRQSQAKVSAFDIQKEAYVRQLNDESNMLRLQMERDVRARLAEDEARHNDNVSGLRRQIMEANNSISQTKRELHDMEEMSSNREAETHRLSAQVSVVAAELSILQYKAHSMEQNRDQTDSELRISQEQLGQYMEMVAEWSLRAEKNTLESARRCKEIDDEFKRSRKVAEVEGNRLQALVLVLEKKNDNSEIVYSNVARYLRSRGLLKAGLTLAEWALRLPSEHSQQEETNLDPSIPLVIGELHKVTALSPESYSHSSGNKVGTSAVSSSNKQMLVVVPNDTSAQLAGEYTPRAANSPYALLDDDRRRRLSVNDSSLLSSHSISPCKSVSRDTSEHERHLSARSVELTSASRALSNVSQPFPTTEATPRSYLRASDYLDGSNVHASGPKKLEGAARTVIPDSQDELTQKRIPTLTRPTRRVAERRHSTPHLRAGNRTVTRTEFTEYSIRTSEMYDDTPTLQYDVTGCVHFGEPVTNLNAVDSDVESSGLSDPPDNMEAVDSTEYLDDSDGNDRKDPEILWMSNKKSYTQSMTSPPAPSPEPNSSRVRTQPPVQAKEIKPPKSILKRTNTTIRNDATSDTHSSKKPLKNAQPSKAQGIHGGSVAKARLSRTTRGNNGINGAAHGSSYNRVVSGNRISQNSSYFQAPDVPSQAQGPSTADIFAISSSPAMGQPKRNSKKRALSGVGINDNSRPAKLQRSARH